MPPREGDLQELREPQSVTSPHKNPEEERGEERRIRDGLMDDFLGSSHLRKEGAGKRLVLDLGCHLHVQGDLSG